MMNPTGARLLIEVDEKKAPKKGEELAAATSMMTGKVILAGPEVKAIKEGDNVVFAPYGIDEVSTMVGKKLKKLLLVSEDLILAING